MHSATLKIFNYHVMLVILSSKTQTHPKRLFLRDQLKIHNRKLAGAAKEAGVVTPLDYAIFQDHGYKGLYGGLGAKDIHRSKRLKKEQVILDHMGSTELAANLFRATQTEEKIKRENIKGKDKANLTHFEVGKKVRRTIKELGGTIVGRRRGSDNSFNPSRLR